MTPSSPSLQPIAPPRSTARRITPFFTTTTYTIIPMPSSPFLLLRTQKRVFYRSNALLYMYRNYTRSSPTLLFLRCSCPVFFNLGLGYLVIGWINYRSCVLLLCRCLEYTRPWLLRIFSTCAFAMQSEYLQVCGTTDTRSLFQGSTTRSQSSELYVYACYLLCLPAPR